MSVIIRLQNLPWSANALDIRNYFRGLSIPEGGVHIVGGELGDAFIAFSTDEDARQAMMLDGGKIKEIQVKLLLSSRSEMHKVIEAARQTVPILSLAPTVAASAPVPVPAPVPAPVPVNLPTPVPQSMPSALTPFSTVLGSSSLSGFGIPGLGNPQEIPQPAVIEPPALLISPQSKTPEEEENDDKSETKRNKDRRRSRSHSRSRDRDRKDRKRDRRDRSRSRERRRRERSRSRERRDRKRDRKDRSRSRERSPRRLRDKRNDRRSPMSSQERTTGDKINDVTPTLLTTYGNSINVAHNNGQHIGMPANSPLLNGPVGQANSQGTQGRFADPALKEAFNKLQELGKKRNPNAFQGDQNSGGSRLMPGRGGNNNARGGGNLRRDGRQSRFDDAPVANCCVAIRNAPNHTSYGDVRRFFPFMIDKHGIKMINDNTGCRTGSIFVRFCDPRSKQLALQKQPNELKGSLVVVESLEDELYDSAVDSYLPFRDDNDEEEHSSNVDADNRRPLFKFSVLKLADLPNFVKEHDIMKAFSDFSLLSILLNDCRVTRTKIAFVQFVKPDDARKALERKESYLFGRRQPIITPVTDEEYDSEKVTSDKMEPQMNRLMNNEPAPEPAVPRDPRQRRQNDNGPGSNTSNIQGQPPFFAPNGPFPQNFNTPFANPQFAAYPSGNMDPRTAAATWANRPPFPKKKEPARGQPGINQQVISLDIDDEPLDCVLMKGLPREATDRTILDFLAETGAVPARIHLMLDGHGRPSGDCFCEFRTSEEARQAVTKHGHNLDGNRVTVDLVMRSVVEEALEGPKTEMKRDMIGNAPLMSTPNNNGPPGQQFFDSPRDNFSGRGAFRGRGFQRGSFDRGGFNRGGFDQSRGNFRGRGNWNDRGRGFDRGRGRGFGRGRGGFDGGRDQMRNEDDDTGLEDFGAPGCVVTLENVPFRATVDDILNFFGDFELTQDDVIRRYNERGQPTGDARVAFATPAHAQRAVATRNMNTIFERRVSLSLL